MLKKGNGWFTATIRSLVEADLATLQSESWFRYGAKLDKIEITLANLMEDGFARISRRGWKVIEHPVLGQISWRQGVDFRTCGGYLYLRVNGQLILSVWPRAGHQHAGYIIKWEAPKAATLSEEVKGWVIHSLCR